MSTATRTRPARYVPSRRSPPDCNGSAPRNRSRSWDNRPANTSTLAGNWVPPSRPVSRFDCKSQRDISEHWSKPRPAQGGDAQVRGMSRHTVNSMIDTRTRRAQRVARAQQALDLAACRAVAEAVAWVRLSGMPMGPLPSGRKATLLNQYTGITDCYDLLMRGGYYDHDTMAGAADAVMGDRKKVLELGVGTGLFAQSLAGRKPDCDITGVDFTPSMLEIAQDRVGADTRLIEADVTSMDLEDTFDAAISSGGVWVIIDAEDEFLLGTHLSHRDQEVEGLKNVSAHLESDGLLLLSIQEMHHDLDLTLPEGVVYSQRISVTEETEELDEHFMIEKQYSFTQDSEVIGEETLNLGFYRQNAMDEILGEAGFEFERIDDDRQFFVYSNRTESPAASA